MDILEPLRRVSEECPDAPALVDSDGETLWRDLPRSVNRLCLGLVHMGLRRHRPAALLLQRGRPLAQALLAVLRGGGTALPLSGKLPVSVLTRSLEALEPTLLVVDESNRRLAATLMEAYDFRGVVHVGERGGLEAREIASWEKVTRTDAHGASFPSLEPDHLALLQPGWTTGGEFRWGEVTLAALLRGADLGREALQIPAGAAHLSVHSAGFGLLPMLLRPLLTGGAAVFPPSSHPKAVHAALVRHRVGLLSAPAAYFETWFDFLEASGMEPPESLEILEAWGHTPLRLRHQARVRTGLDLLPAWGTVEAFGPMLGACRIGLGIPPGPLQAYPGLRERIVSPQEEPILDREVGEMQLRGDSLLEATRTLRGERVEVGEGGGWWRTGLLAFRHASGAVELVGTRYDCLLRDGKRVVPGRAAHLAEQNPKVRSAQIVLMENEIHDFRIVLAVLPDRAAEVLPEQVLDSLRDQLPPPEMPDEAVLLERLPRRCDGEVDTLRLHKMLRENLA